MATINLTEESFAAEIGSPEPVLVDFWAEWCGPCHALGPVIEEVALDYAGRVKVGKLNVDESPEVALEYQIRSIPTMIIFKDGKEVGKIVGVVHKQDITDALDTALQAG